MKKLHILLPSGTVFENEFELHEGMYDFIDKSRGLGHEVIFISNNRNKKNMYKQTLNDLFNAEFEIYERKEIKRYAKEPNINGSLKTTIMVGADKYDLFMASALKILFLHPTWSIVEDQALATEYGLPVQNPNELYKILEILNNQSKFYYTLYIDEKTTLHALTSANNHGASKKESDMITDFRAVLKVGKRAYFDALFLHMISSVMKSDELRKIDIWGIMPSSSTSLNSDMLEIKDRCRYLTGRRLKEPLLIRHKSVPKSHQTPKATRLSVGANKHLESININPYYKDKLQGKTICILDDYVTNGISFDAVRNLLLNAGAEKIYFFAFGRFKSGNYGVYQKEDFEISGNIFSESYTFKSISTPTDIASQGIYDQSARKEVEKLREILSS